MKKIKKIKKIIHKYETLEKIVLFFWSIFFIARARLIFRKIKPNLKKDNFKIIILAIRTIPTTNLVYFDAIFGRTFKKLGCDVKMLYCDGVLDSCDADTIFRSQKAACFVCKKLGRFVKNAFDLNCISYREHVSDSEIREIEKKVASLGVNELLNYQYLGIDVGRRAQASAIRYFLFGGLDLKNPLHVNKLREKLVYAMIAAKIAESIVTKEKPDSIFMLHGNYSTWGPFLDYFRLKGIDAVVYNNMPPKYGCFIFNHNTKANDIISKTTWSDFKIHLLKEKEKAQIDVYINKRLKGETGDHELYERCLDTKTKKQFLLKSLSKEKYSRRYVMYTNLAWDAAIQGCISEIFDDFLSWVDKTVEFFKRRKDYQLIVRTHPAELVWEECNQEMADYISEKHGPLPENITILKPNVPLRAYDLITPDTIGIVFNGTLGMELAVLGVPVLVAADIHYREAGVVYRVKTLGEYLNLLDNPEKLISFAKDNQELAKKYAYFYFFKSMVKIPFYSTTKWSTIDWGTVADTKRLLADNSNLIKICKKIINKEDIAAPL